MNSMRDCLIIGKDADLLPIICSEINLRSEVDLLSRIRCFRLEVKLSTKSQTEKSYEKNKTQAGANYPQAVPGGGSAGVG